MNYFPVIFRSNILCILLIFFTYSTFAQPDADVPRAIDKTLISDNLTVHNSACVGGDCVTNEAYGFNTLRLKENNLRIHFDDTSEAASFPRNDWAIYINDTTNGGSSYFGVTDETAGRQVFRIFAGARSNALVVDSGGDLGLGTATPATEIEIKDGDTPTIRLQQDNTSGFTPQSWDVAGNETNFFIRDATGGSQLPFKIRPGADNNALVVDTDNDIGMGIAVPTDDLHIRKTDAASTGLTIENTNGSSQSVNFRLINANGEWNGQLQISGNYRLRDVVSGSDGLKIKQGAPPSVTIPGDLTVNGTFSNPSDKRLKSNIQPFTKGLEAVLQLEPVTYKYNGIGGLAKQNSHVGLVAQNLRKVAPEMVSNFEIQDEENSGVYLRIHDSEIKYLLINSIKEQQLQVEKLISQNKQLELEVQNLRDISEEFSTLKKEMEELKKFLSAMEASDVSLDGKNAAYLSQNVPNPYSNVTKVTYFIPANTKNAEIQFYDVSGKLIKKFPIVETGKGQLNISAQELPQGNYSYTLFINGERIDSKKMVLQK